MIRSVTDDLQVRPSTRQSLASQNQQPPTSRELQDEVQRGTGRQMVTERSPERSPESSSKQQDSFAPQLLTESAESQMPPASNCDSLSQKYLKVEERESDEQALAGPSGADSSEFPSATTQGTKEAGLVEKEAEKEPNEA